MGFLVKAIANIAPYIYATCGLLALFQLYRTWQVRAERRQAVFSLERDKAIDDLYRIFLSALLMLVVMGFTYFASTTLREAMIAVESSSVLSSPDDPSASPDVSLSALIPTPTFTPEPPTPTPLPTRIVVPTPVPDNREEDAQPEEPAPAPNQLPVSPALCPDGRAVILSPGNGAIVSGDVPIVGTAQHDQFSFYKLEFAPGGATQSFNYFDGAESPVVGGLLGNLNSSAMANGTYVIQVVVVDTTGNYPQPCSVTVTVQN
ncbi:MAG: hypothetical protein OXG26_08755 [Caldilineaceae bacterium]|nr:hypothetical protein [Caldilineaceae bacterium]